MEEVKPKGHYHGGRSNLAPMRKFKEKNILPALRFQIKSMYESGMYNSVEEVHADCKKLFLDCPTLWAIKRLVMEEKWDKFKMKKVMEEVRQTNYKELFAAEGMGDEETVREVVSGIKLADTTINAISTRITKAMQDNKGEFVPSAETLDYLKGLTKELFDNFKIKERFLEQRHKLCEAGSYGRQKITITPAAEDPNTMTPDEAKRELERIAKAVAVQG